MKGSEPNNQSRASNLCEEHAYNEEKNLEKVNYNISKCKCLEVEGQYNILYLHHIISWSCIQRKRLFGAGNLLILPTFPANTQKA